MQSRECPIRLGAVGSGHEKLTRRRWRAIPAWLRRCWVRAVDRRGWGRFAEGLTVCNQALGFHPADARLLNNRAVILCGLHRFQEALADCDNSLAIRPDPVTRGVRGSALLGLQRFDAALVAFDAALVDHPRRADVLINRGHALRELGRLPEALASYDQALALELDNALALVNRAVVLSEERRFTDALASLEKAMMADPSESHALGLAANAALELCDWPRSEALGARLAVQGRRIMPLCRPWCCLG